MGTCFQGPYPKDVERSAMIDDELRVEKQQRYNCTYSRLYKLLLVGTKCSGKTTMLKQLNHIYGEAYDSNYRDQFITSIYKQCIEQMKIVIDLLNDQLHNNKDIGLSIDALKAKQLIVDCNLLVLDKKIIESIKVLWNEWMVQQVYMKNINNGNLQHSSEYFWNHIDRICKENYCPTDRDILNVYHPSVNIEIQHLMWKKYDSIMYFAGVNGQQLRKPKWIEYFEDFDAIMFVASLACYDSQVVNDLELLVYRYIDSYCFNAYIPIELIEIIILFCGKTEGTNKMTKQLKLFDEIVNHYGFIDMNSTVLLLNKADLFADKIQRIPINVCPSFEEYNGDDSFDESVEFIKSKFAQTHRAEDVALCIHSVTATDKDYMHKVFDDIFHAIWECRCLHYENFFF
eukprot:366573_1